MSEQDQIEDTAEDIAEARRQGWRPESEWDEARAEKEGRRKPKEFLTAREFLDRMSGNIPMLSERLRTTTTKLTAIERELLDERKAREEQAKKNDEMHQILSDQARRNKEAVVRARENGRREAEEAMEQAVLEGDTKAHKEAKDKLFQIQGEEMAEVKAAAAPKPIEEKPVKAGGPSAAITQWVAENPWFKADKVLNAAMVETHEAVIKEFPAMSESDQLDEAADRVRAEFRSRFTREQETKEQDDETPKRAAAAVSRPSYVKGSRDTVEARFSRIPKEDQDAYFLQAKRMKADRKYDYTKAEFMKEYE